MNVADNDISTSDRHADDHPVEHHPRQRSGQQVATTHGTVTTRRHDVQLRADGQLLWTRSVYIPSFDPS